MGTVVDKISDGSSSLVTAPDLVPNASAGSHSTRLLRWLPAAVTVAVTVVIFLGQGVTTLELMRYGGYVLWALTLPGTLVYRASRRVPHSLVDDLAVGTALGFVLEVPAWAIYAATDAQSYLWTWPALVVTLFLAVPRLHRHWRMPDGYRAAPVGWSWAVAGIALTLVVYLGVTLLYATPTPRDEAHWYYQDNTYLLSIVADARHHFPLATPQVASEPLNYHWFAYAHMASSSLISGLEAPIIYYRFALPTICTAAVVLMAVVGWRVTGRAWVGAMASALMFLVAEFTAQDYVMFGMIGRWMISNSPSMSYAWLSTFPLIMTGVDLIRRGGLPDAPLGRGAWALLTLFAAAAAGAKSTILFVLLAGFGMAGIAEFVRHRFRLPRNLLIASAIVAATIVLAMRVLYGGESGGLLLSPLQLLKFYVPDVPRSALKEVAVLGFMGGAYVIYMLARLLGIPVLAWLTWRRRGTIRDDSNGADEGAAGYRWCATEWFLLGAVVAGLLGAMLLWHIGSAQVYLLRSAWPFGAILSALGMAILVDRHRIPPKVVAGVVAGAVVLAYLIVYVLLSSDAAVPGKGARFVLPIYWAAMATIVACSLIGLAWLLIRRRLEGRLRGLGAVSALTLVLVMGVPVFLREIYSYGKAEYTESAFYSEKVTPDGIAMTDWIKANVSPEEVLATNGHCPAGDPKPKGPCLHLTSWLSAYSERRVVVAGWGYVGRSHAEAAERRVWIGGVPFFDPHKLAVNDAAFDKPSPAVLAELRDRYDADWLVVDRTVTRESPMLRDLVPLRYERGDYAVYELR